MPAVSKSAAEFFAENMNIAGFGNPYKALYTSIRELVENGLDAAEEIGVLPEIKVRLRKLSKEELSRIIGVTEEIQRRIQEYLQDLAKAKKGKKIEEEEEETGNVEVFELIVEDNGSGMAYKEIPFLMGQVLTSTKYELRQQRGRFGLGGKMVLIYSIKETGTPIEIWSKKPEDNFVSHYILTIDLQKNEPIVLLKKRIPKNKFRDPWGKKLEHGTIIKVYILGDWKRAKKYVYDYFKLMAVITPYATFVFEDPDGNVIIYERVTKEMPPAPKSVKYHPQGIDTQILRSLLEQTKAKTIKKFFLKEFQGVTSKLIDEFLSIIGLDPNMPVEEVRNNRNLIASIVEVARNFKFRSPKASALSPIGPKLLEEGIRKIFEPEFVYVIQRKPVSYMGHPMIVEIGVAYGGKIPTGINLYRFANRVPLLHKEKSDVSWKVIEKINWNKYKINKDEDSLAIFISVVSTKIPFSETSKDYMDDVDVLRNEIRLGLLQALRRLREYINKKTRITRMLKKRRMFLHYAGNLARSISSILKTDEKYKDNFFAKEDFLFSTIIDLVDIKLGGMTPEGVEETEQETSEASSGGESAEEEGTND